MSAGVAPTVLKRLIRRLPARWPAVIIEALGDSGFAVRTIYDYLDAQHIHYTIAIGCNPRLEALAAALAERAQTQRAATGEQVRLFGAGQH